MPLSLISVIALAACSREISNLCGLLVSITRTASNGVHLAPEQRVTIIIPVFNEEEIVQQTCQYFANLIQSRPKCSLVICGTARERRKGINPTLTKAKHAFHGLTNCFVIESSDEFGSKAEQLNFAFKFTRTTYSQYFGIYDVDSRPSSTTLVELDRVIAAHNAPIIQQHALFIGNISQISRRPLQLGQALYQSRWTLAHEIPRFALYRVGITPFVHLVGHGLFITQQTVEKFRGFPTGTVVDDAHIGLFSTASGLCIRSLHVLDVSDNPSTLKQTFQQLSGWSRGPLDVGEYVKSYKAAGFCTPLFRSIRLRLAAYLYWIQWVVTTPAIVILLFAICGRNPVATLWFILYVTDFTLAYMAMRYRFGAKRMPNLLYSICSMLAFAMVCSVPAFAAFAAKILGLRVKKYKTSHRSL